MGKDKSSTFNSLDALSNLLSQDELDQFEREEEAKKAELPAYPTNQLLEVHYEKKGRAGKAAIVVVGFEGSEDELKALAKDLKQHCATGGSVKEGEIIIQGSQRDKVMDFLKKQGFKTKRVGG